MRDTSCSLSCEFRWWSRSVLYFAECNIKTCSCLQRHAKTMLLHKNYYILKCQHIAVGVNPQEDLNDGNKETQFMDTQMCVSIWLVELKECIIFTIAISQCTWRITIPFYFVWSPQYKHNHNHNNRSETIFVNK